jgi:glucose/arabinose dehydrogenase
MGRGWAVAAVMSAGMALCAPPAPAGPPAGFEQSVAFSGLEQPTTVAVGEDGGVFVGEQSGIILSYSGPKDGTATRVADLRTEVHDAGDRGLLALALDPGYPRRPYLYALYTRDAAPGAEAPLWGQAGESGDPCPGDPVWTEGCIATGRLARLRLSGGVAVEAEPLLTGWCQQAPSHSIGDLAFAADGSLYVSGGEGASFVTADWGQYDNPCGDPPGSAGLPLTPPEAEGGALRSQDVRTGADPAGYGGSILRVDPADGSAVPGNPFGSSPDAAQRRVIAYGQRNPFRIAVRPGTAELWSADAGWRDWEEVNRVSAPEAPAENFGWPCYEGGDAGSSRQPSYEAAGLSLCESLYAPGDPNASAPYFAYPSEGPVGDGDCAPDHSALSGLSFAPPGALPAEYEGALFLADIHRGCILAMRSGPDGLPDPARVTTFDSDAGFPVDLEFGPGGDLYVADVFNGEIRRIQPPPGLLAPSGSPGSCGGRPATHAGTPGPDRLVGTPGRDVIAGGSGRDTLLGRGGDDLICGGMGADRLAGGRGRDRCIGGPGPDAGKSCERADARR